MKLTQEQRDQIKKRHTGGEKVAQLAKEYGVSKVAIYCIINEKYRQRQKEYHKEYCQRPEVRKRKKEYYHRPEQVAKRKQARIERLEKKLEELKK